MGVRILDCLLGSTAIVASIAVAGPAEAQTRTFNLQAQDARKGIPTFAKQANVQLLASDRILRGKRTNAVIGSHTTQEALRLLLDGTNLVAAPPSSGGGVIIIREAMKTASLAAFQPTMAAEPVSSLEQGGSQAPVEESGEEEAQDIVVTGSHIDRPGFQAPTPTTVIGETELRQAGRNNVAEVLADVPQVRFTNNPINNVGGSTTSGTATSDIRGLGSVRTLALLNGRRFAGEGDFNTIPFRAVRRVDVVTGGASAAYGSGAVSGVVNIILDDSYDGVEASAEYGISGRGDAREYTLGLLAGSNFAGGRGNVLLSAEFAEMGGIPSRQSRPWLGTFEVANNPAATPTNGLPPLYIAPDVRLVNFSRGGLVQTGVLAGLQFLPDGTLAPFQRGVGAPALGSGTATFPGGEGPSLFEEVWLRGDSKRINLFGMARYDLTDGIRLTAELLYAKTHAENNVIPTPRVVPVSIENPFLPAAARQRMVAAGQTTFNLGRFNADLGTLYYDQNRETFQATIALNGRIGDKWRWDAYYSYQEFWSLNLNNNNLIVSNFQEAVDVVAGPGGTPICRVRLTVTTSPCVPLNVFGEGASSQAARNYVMGTGTDRNHERTDIVAATLRGEPVELWAGPVSVAFGAEYRKSEATREVDALSQANRFGGPNPKNGFSNSSVKEAFAEIVLPLVRDVPMLKLLEVNAAARVTDYAATGTVWTWKVGATNQVMDGWRVRGVVSRDIRAPTFGDLFGGQSQSQSNVVDPFRNNQANLVLIVGGSNPNLTPERSTTYSLGTVFQPAFVPGLSVSVDYYKIRIRDMITTLGAVPLVTACFAGNQGACGAITRNPPGPGETIGTIKQINATTVNLARFETSGIDFELAYRMPAAKIFAAAPGSLQFRLLGTWVDELISDNGLTAIDLVGSLLTTSGANTGVPSFRTTASLSYNSADFSMDFRARYIGSGVFDVTRNIADSDVAAVTYFDLGFKRSFPLKGSRIELFGSVANLFDKKPPILAQAYWYDHIGRFFNLGARVKF